MTSSPLSQLQGKLIVSCQAWEDDAFFAPGEMARFARAALEGGASAIRANGPEDVAEIANAVHLPVLGIQKRLAGDGRILITPSLEDARSLAVAGAACIALDCTARGRHYGALDRLRMIKSELGLPVAADIATLEDAIFAAAAGADFVLSTMRGYTADTAGATSFDIHFIRDLVHSAGVPVIAEGRIWTTEQAVGALDAGAFAVVVGSAITRPRDITARYASAIQSWSHNRSRCFVGVDLGATNIKYGLVNGDGVLTHSGSTPCPAEDAEQILREVGRVVSLCIGQAHANGMSLAGVGVAATGWPDPKTGIIVEATDGIKGWKGTPLGPYLEQSSGLPVAVENDANALAVAEKTFGLAKDIDNFAVITLGTGVGGGCYVNNRLMRGSHMVANAIGHITVVPGGLPCQCGLLGCVESYVSAAALVRSANLEGIVTAKDVITRANEGDPLARSAMEKLAGHLAAGCAAVSNLLDPELIVLAGGLVQNNPLLIEYLEKHLAARLAAGRRGQAKICVSGLGYFAGVIGGAACAIRLA